MARVVVVGSAVLDFVYSVDALPATAEKFAATAMQIVGGGCAANAAVGIARLGGEAALIARFGQDEVHDLVTRDLLVEGVDLSGLSVRTGARSAVSSVYVDARGERQIMAFRGENLPLDAPEIGPADAVLVDTRWPEAGLVALRAAKEQGIPGVLDGEAPVDAAMARAASHVVFSEQGLMSFADAPDIQAALQAVAQDLPGWVGVTCGAEGCYWSAEGIVHHQPAFEVGVVDTLGAGDIWHGAFALLLAENGSEADAVRFASAAAALKCMGHGGRAAAPDRMAVKDFLERSECES